MQVANLIAKDFPISERGLAITVRASIADRDGFHILFIIRGALIPGLALLPPAHPGIRPPIMEPQVVATVPNCPLDIAFGYLIIVGAADHDVACVNLGHEGGEQKEAEESNSKSRCKWKVKHCCAVPCE
jgi:hypothetical protein